ncbi:MAG: hypothetical protein ACLT98_09870 [Eggerthellaceae bacterium]
MIARIPEWDAPSEPGDAIPADPDVRDWSYAESGGALYFRMGPLMHRQNPSKAAAERIGGMIPLRDCARRLITLEKDGAPDAEVEAERARLNALYDAYAAKHGILNSRANAAALKAGFLLPAAVRIGDPRRRGETSSARRTCSPAHDTAQRARDARRRPPGGAGCLAV